MLAFTALRSLGASLCCGRHQRKATQSGAPQGTGEGWASAGLRAPIWTQEGLATCNKWEDSLAGSDWSDAEILAQCKLTVSRPLAVAGHLTRACRLGSGGSSSKQLTRDNCRRHLLLHCQLVSPARLVEAVASLVSLLALPQLLLPLLLRDLTRGVQVKGMCAGRHPVG